MASEKKTKPTVKSNLYKKKTKAAGRTPQRKV